MSTRKSKTVSLVLGSGGARGLAHIGIIHWLEENGYQIKAVSGCSMGALIGGIYAAGKLDDYEHWVRAVTRLDIVTLLDLSWQKTGLVKGDKIISTLIELVGNRLIEELPIPFTAVASDIEAEKEVWIQSGRLFDAIRASIALPLFFTPFQYRGAYLIDGGILNPVPIAPTFGDATDITIAINLNGPPLEQAAPVEVTEQLSSDVLPFRANINRFIERLQQAAKMTNDHDWGAYDIVMQSFEAMQSTIARQKLAAYPPDKIIEISRNACAALEFERAAEMIELGYRKAEECLSALKKDD